MPTIAKLLGVKGIRVNVDGKGIPFTIDTKGGRVMFDPDTTDFCVLGKVDYDEDEDGDPICGCTTRCGDLYLYVFPENGVAQAASVSIIRDGDVVDYGYFFDDYADNFDEFTSIIIRRAELCKPHLVDHKLTKALIALNNPASIDKRKLRRY